MGNASFRAVYLDLSSQELAERASALKDLMRGCRLCPRECGVDRLAGGVGECGLGADPVVSSYGPHFGEERPLVGRHGSGTVFLTSCNLKCVFCQNFDISHLRRGRRVTVSDLADMMLDLQRQECHNINWVTPTHQVSMLVEALAEARDRGLRAPLVYNCGGYEGLEALHLLDGIVDIYMPDAKYGDNRPGADLSGVPDYWDRCREAVREMHRQVGDLQIDEAGVATRGLLVRHLVLPENLAKTGEVMQFLASLSTDIYVNVMAQYRPEYRAADTPALRRGITSKEYRQAVEAALRAGLHRLDER